MARQALRRSRSQTVRGAIIFLEDYFKAREGMEVPDDIHTALLTVAETGSGSCPAGGLFRLREETPAQPPGPRKISPPRGCAPLPSPSFGPLFSKKKRARFFCFLVFGPRTFVLIPLGTPAGGDRHF